MANIRKHAFHGRSVNIVFSDIGVLIFFHQGLFNKLKHFFAVVELVMGAIFPGPVIIFKIFLFALAIESRRAQRKN